MGTLLLVWRIATGPVWLLWSGYKSLWWVFGDTHEPTKTSSPGSAASRIDAGAAGQAGVAADQASAFEVVDTSPRTIPPPISRLRAGFIGTVLSSGGLLLASNAMGAAGVVSPDRAFAAWVWGTALTAVLSIFIVRRSARMARQKRGVAAMLRSVREATVNAAAGAAVGAAGACRWAAGSIKDGITKGACEKARHRCGGGIKQSVAGACSAARRAWNSIGRPAAGTRTAA